MPGQESSNGRTFIWIIACVLFICIVAGGVCLGAYMLLPDEQVASWVPALGVTLVCLPWAFWIFTFLYRVLSRAFGFRVSFGHGGGGGGGNARESAAVVDIEGASGQANRDGNSSAASRGGLQRTSSVASSHESEVPLAKSMNS